MRVYHRELDGLGESSVLTSLKYELLQTAKVIGVKSTIEALLRLGAITFSINNLGVVSTAWYSITVDGEKLMFAKPQELLRKLDELGVFGE